MPGGVGSGNACPIALELQHKIASKMTACHPVTVLIVSMKSDVTALRLLKPARSKASGTARAWATAIGVPCPQTAFATSIVYPEMRWQLYAR